MKTDKILDQERIKFEKTSLAINNTYSKIKKEIRTNADSSKLGITPEGRRIMSIMKELDNLISQDYHYAVKQAKEPKENDLEKEQEIANIYNARERLVYTEHQLMMSRKHIAKILSQKERLEYYEELKEVNADTAKNFYTQVIQKKDSFRIKKVASTASLNKPNDKNFKTQTAKGLSLSKSKKILRPRTAMTRRV